MGYFPQLTQGKQLLVGSSGSYKSDLLSVYHTFSSLFLISASKCGHQCCKHRLFHAHYGVWQIHLCARESRRYSSGRDHWYERHRQPSEEADLCRLRNHEPHQQGYCTQRSATDAIAQGFWDSEINTGQLFVLVIIILTVNHNSPRSIWSRNSLLIMKFRNIFIPVPY